MTYLIGQPLPALRRDLEITPVVHEGQPMLALRDPMEEAQDVALLAPGAVAIASLFNGELRAEEIREFLNKEKVMLSANDIQSLANQLSEHKLLETSEVEAQRQRRYEEFRQSSVRKFHAISRGIPADPLEFGMFLGRFFKDPQGPGEAFSGNPEGNPPLGLVSPHIDLFRGGPHYAWAYNELLKRPKPDVIVALGVAHLSPKSPWVMTRKSYATPLGPVEVDESLYDEIQGALWYDAAEEEWTHAREHSLEFQALWIKHLWMKDTPKWVPILCSSFELFCTDRPPSAIQTIEEAVKKIGAIIAARAKKGEKIMVLAGVDLAHVGKKFGDELPITPELKKKIEDLDRDSLEKILRLDADPFFMTGIGENEWRKVCGLSALYTAGRWIKALSNGNPVKGRLLSYGQAPDPADGVVSFASAVFEMEN